MTPARRCGDDPGQPFARPEPQIPQPVAEAVPGPGDQGLAGLVPEVDDDRPDVQQLGRQPADELQQRGEVRLAGQPGGDLAHGLKLASALVLALVQLRVLDGDGRLPGERFEQPHLDRPEALLGSALHHQDADHAILVAQRDAEPGAEAVPLGDGAVHGILARLGRRDRRRSPAGRSRRPAR